MYDDNVNVSEYAARHLEHLAAMSRRKQLHRAQQVRDALYQGKLAGAFLAECDLEDARTTVRAIMSTAEEDYDSYGANAIPLTKGQYRHCLSSLYRALSEAADCSSNERLLGQRIWYHRGSLYSVRTTEMPSMCGGRETVVTQCLTVKELTTALTYSTGFQTVSRDPSVPPGQHVIRHDTPTGKSAPPEALLRRLATELYEASVEHIQEGDPARWPYDTPLNTYKVGLYKIAHGEYAVFCRAQNNSCDSYEDSVRAVVWPNPLRHKRKVTLRRMGIGDCPLLSSSKTNGEYVTYLSLNKGSGVMFGVERVWHALAEATVSLLAGVHLRSNSGKISRIKITSNCERSLARYQAGLVPGNVNYKTTHFIAALNVAAQRTNDIGVWQEWPVTMNGSYDNHPTIGGAYCAEGIAPRADLIKGDNLYKLNDKVYRKMRKEYGNAAL